MVEQELGYATMTSWGWVFMIYFFGVLLAFCVSVFTFDDLTFSKRKKFTLGAMLLAIFFALFSWFGLIALIKFDNKHNGDKFRY
jgi:hypothetical protein